jgi:hypothetical protein
MNKDRRKQIDKTLKLLLELSPKWDEIKSLVTSAAEGERESFDNMSENLQDSEQGRKIDTAACLLEEIQFIMDAIDMDDLVAKIEEAAE